MTNKKSMKKVKRDELRPEYKRSDLGRGVRGKYYKSYQSGTNLVLLSPDVAEVFPDADAVNEALRTLIKAAHHSVSSTKRSGRCAKTRSRAT
ncbi:MAG: hypothetical protein MPW16_09780 [Candidatus Manganitrophus sp.]|nr:MAG: hypothetical protein MPW16_09780 [Candidatus Manganitrophus sp.]